MSLLKRWRTKSSIEAELKAQLPMLTRIVATYEADSHLQEELLQEVVLAAWQASNQFEGRAQAKTFFARIAHNRCVTHVSTAVRRPQWSGGDDPEMIEANNSNEHHAQLQALQHQIRQLPLQPRQVMSLFLEGFSYDQIATICELSRTNVGAILTRTKAQLAQYFNGDS